MSTRLERVLDIGTALAGLCGAADIVRLFSNPAKRHLGFNRLTREKLVADPRQQSPKDLRTAGQLLPFYQTIPFAFRNTELEDYLNWCGKSDEQLAVRLITGASGRGKTRLMVELAGKLRDNGPIRPGFTGSNWVSGFIDLPALQRAANGGLSDPYEVPFAANVDLCLIVDYAENRPDEVQRLLKAALAAIDKGRTGLIRIILIARQHTEIFSTILQDSVLADRASAEIFDAPLKPVADPDAFFAHACEALKLPSSARVYPEGLRSETPDCGLLSLAALLAATEQTPTTGSQEQILDKILDHERRYWKEAAQRHGCPEILIKQNVHELVAATLTFYGLQGAIPDIAAGVELISDIPLLADQDYTVRSALVRSISELYPHPDGRIEGVALDLLGDHLVVKNDAADMTGLSEAQIRSAMTRTTWIARCTVESARKLLHKLLSADPEKRLATVLDMTPAVGDPLGRLASEWILENPIDPNHARQLEQALPERSLALREFALTITRNALLDGGIQDDEGHAGLLNNLANRLSELDQREAALEAAQESMALRRKLAEVRPDAFTPDLAASLNNLANRLSELGQSETALEASKEAVALYRKLVEARPDDFAPNLASSLRNLAYILSKLRQSEAALEAAQEAVALRRKLVEARPDGFSPDLASSLDSLANRLSELGQREAALEAAQEAVALYRKLVEVRPDAFTPDLAASLNNLANRLSELGQCEAALEAAQEAVALYRKLAEVRPDAFTPDLATSLHNLAGRLSELGQRETALEAAQEAVALFRKLAEVRPDAFSPDLADSLNNLANRLFQLGQCEAALEAAQEAVALYRKLAEAQPNAFTPDLAKSLGVLSAVLTGLDLHVEAERALHEAVRILSRLFLTSCVPYNNLMKQLCTDYSKVCDELKRNPDMELLAPIIAVFEQSQ